MTKGPNQIAEEVKQSWTRWTMILDLLSHSVWNLQKKVSFNMASEANFINIFWRNLIMANLASFGKTSNETF